MQTKSDLRTFAKNLRKTLDMENISKIITNTFLNSKYFKTNNHFAFYYPYGTEIDFKEIFKNQEKNYYLPKITNSNDMEFIRYNYEDKLLPDKYGILEPIGEKADYSKFDAIILPALMVDKSGYRLGYGKGYYDKFLSNNNICAIKIIFIPEELFIDNLPVDDYDIPADVVITQNNIYKIK